MVKRTGKWQLGMRKPTQISVELPIYIPTEHKSGTVQYSGVKRRVIRWKSTDDSEENIASNFRVEE
jgi:hypothetical protein